MRTIPVEPGGSDGRESAHPHLPGVRGQQLRLSRKKEGQATAGGGGARDRNEVPLPGMWLRVEGQGKAGLTGDA